MKTAATTATFAALLAVASAADGVVTIAETPCPNAGANFNGAQFQVPINGQTDVSATLKSTCGLKIVSVSGASADGVKCQAFKDAQGTSPGSKEFTSQTPATISTNPVQESLVKCSGPSTGATSSSTGAASSATGAASGGIVLLETTPTCVSSNAKTVQFTVPIGQLTQQKLDSVCGIKIKSASGVDVNAVKCQAYKDAAGAQKGSAEFSFGSPANIATNPVQEQSIKCYTSGSSSSGDAGSSGSLPSPTGGAGGAGGVGGSSNGTAPTVTGGPSATDSTVPYTGGAGSIGVSMAVIAVAFAAYLF